MLDNNNISTETHISTTGINTEVSTGTAMLCQCKNTNMKSSSQYHQIHTYATGTEEYTTTKKQDPTMKCVRMGNVQIYISIFASLNCLPTITSGVNSGYWEF